MYNNNVRIIGGKFRGKKLNFPSHKVLRPTPNLLRETLFNWLMLDINGARCLDLFAGSGALGFEALSRGADFTVFVDNDLAAVKALTHNALSFDAVSYHIMQMDALRYLNLATAKFDIIFLDPPFANLDGYYACLDLILQKNVLLSGGLLYLEANSTLELSKPWQLLKIKKQSKVYGHLYILSLEELECGLS
jgi:16S rRNA (guanine966-N2)-methyltransferase